MGSIEGLSIIYLEVNNANPERNLEEQEGLGNGKSRRDGQAVFLTG